MNERRYLVLDIETVTDWKLVQQVFGLGENATLEEMRKRLSDRYTRIPPPPFHVPICISLIDVDFETCKILNATVLENVDEKSLLQQFWKVVKLRKGKPTETIFVHFNGRSFDLPVLFYRSLKHRIPIVPWDRKRFSFDSSHDICDDLGDFGATTKPSLNIVSKMLGLPGKTDMDGSMVEEMHSRGEKDRIKDYCMEDALATYYIWLTIKLIRGEISEEKYNEAYASAADSIKTCRQRTDTYFTSPEIQATES